LRAQREEDNGFIRRAQLLLQFSDCGVVLQGDLQHFRGMRLCKLLQLLLLLLLMLLIAVVLLCKLLMLLTLAELQLVILYQLLAALMLMLMLMQAVTLMCLMISIQSNRWLFDRRCKLLLLPPICRLFLSRHASPHITPWTRLCGRRPGRRCSAAVDARDLTKTRQWIKPGYCAAKSALRCSRRSAPGS
jgi:hypothetical protein